MKKKKKFFIERTDEDDILDSLSLRVNDILKTDKKIDDKKNNIYFWLFKFLLLIIYLIFINLIFNAIRELGISLIYYVGVSLRGIASFLYSSITIFTQGIVTLYILFKNLAIFMNSNYYKRLYSKDKIMNKKKKNLFGAIYLVLKYLSIPYLIIVSFAAAISLTIFTILAYLSLNGIYSISSILISLTLFALCYFLFRAIQKSFFTSGILVTKKPFYIIFVILFISIILFGYETSSYEYNETLPNDFELEDKEIFFNIADINNVKIKSGSKYENINIYVDDTLENEIRIELSYFPTAKISYTSLFNETDNLLLKFDSKMNFKVENVEDVLKLGIATLENKTIYNYNLFKYPSIKVFTSKKDLSKISLVKYNASLDN